MPYIEVENFNRIACDTGANINFVSMENLPKGAKIMKKHTRTYDCQNNQAESDMVAIVTLVFNPKTTRFELEGNVAAAGIKVEFIITKN